MKNLNIVTRFSSESKLFGKHRLRVHATSATPMHIILISYTVYHHKSTLRNCVVGERGGSKSWPFIICRPRPLWGTQHSSLFIFTIAVCSPSPLTNQKLLVQLPAENIMLDFYISDSEMDLHIIL